MKYSNEIYTTYVNYRYFYRSSIAKKKYYYNTFITFENNTRKIYSFIKS